LGGHEFGCRLLSGVTVLFLFFISLLFVQAAFPQPPAPIKPSSYQDKSNGDAVASEEKEGEENTYFLPMPPPPHKSAAWVLEQMSQTDNPAIRRRAWEAWPLEESEVENLEPLIQQFSDPSASVRAGAEHRLAEIPTATVFAYVMRAFSTVDTVKVQYLEVALPALPPEVGIYLRETLDTEIELPLHRRIAAYVLGRMCYREGIDTLTGHVWSTDSELAYTCVEALRAINDPRSLSLWMQLLGHENAHIRPLAIQGLAVLQSPAAMEQIRRLVLYPGNETAQVNALSATESYPPEWQLPLLVEVMEKNSSLAAHAHRLLRKRSGMRFGTNPAQWRNWLDSLFTTPSPPLVPGGTD
jgi:HEAT repeat protein